MYHRAERNQAATTLVSMGLRSQIQDIAWTSEF